MAKIDWEFSEDGDLVTGDPKVDENGQVLYRHNDGTVDTDKRDDGIEIRDINWVYDLDAEKQIIMNRLRTDSPDWYAHPGMGGNLSDLIGEPNTRETGNMGIQYIIDALTYENLYSKNQILVRPIPISQDTILFMIEIMKFGNQVLRLPITFNLEHGLLDIYEVPKS